MKRDQHKENLRRVYADTVKGIQKDFKETSRLIIQKKVCSIPQFRNATVVSVYVAIDNEVGTFGIFELLWKKGNIIVLAPRIKRKTLEMCQVHSIKDFVQGPYGLKEPALHITPFGGAIDVIIVPGLAFDVHGVRLGRGKGYYDRFLKTDKTFAIGLAYDVQVVLNLPEHAHDMKMDVVITEKRIIHSDSL